MLHGWMDVGASFQFLVDALKRDWFVIAPDWRGFGRSEWCPDGYWFVDYLADLEALLDHFSPGEPARVVGHSLGGNVACLFAGIRPARVSRAISLDGFGIPAEGPELAPDKIAKWLDVEHDRIGMLHCELQRHPVEAPDHREHDQRDIRTAARANRQALHDQVLKKASIAEATATG